MFDTLVNKIIEFSRSQPDKTAVALKQTQLTYAELANKMRAVGTYLHSKGIKAGDRVLLTALSKPETAAIYLGIQYIGAVAVLNDKNASDESSVSIYRDTEASLFITNKPVKGYEMELNMLSLKEVYASADKITADLYEYKLPEPDSLAEMIYTTGTTGRPKGIMLTYSSVYFSMLGMINGLGITAEERYLLPLPLNHSYALDNFRSTLFIGAMVILQNGFMFAGDIGKSIEQYDCTAMAMVPSSIEILKAQFKESFTEILGRLRFIKFGAGQFGIQIQREISAMLPDTVIYNGMGSSETSTIFLLNVSEKVKDGNDMPSVGKPVEGVEIEILDENGVPIENSSADNPGRLAVKSNMIMKGYWRQPELTAQTLKDGFLITNDLVYRDEKGYVYLLGRADDIINVGGEKVSPIEIENTAEQFSGIKECACIGVNDEEKGFGQIPVLFIVPDAGYSEHDLRAYLATRLERFKLPGQYINVTEIPRNRMQKTDRKALKKLYESRLAGDLSADIENDPVIRAILTRRSIRNFTEKDIEQEKLDTILKCGYYAPTGHNMQTWRFTVIRGKEKLELLKKTVFETARNSGMSFYGFVNPNVAVLVSNDVRAICSCEDASAALENMQLAAHALGIGSVWIGVLTTLRHEEPVKSLLDEYGIPDSHAVYGILNLGYAGAPGRLIARKTDVVHYI